MMKFLLTTILSLAFLGTPVALADDYPEWFDRDEALRDVYNLDRSLKNFGIEASWELGEGHPLERSIRYTVGENLDLYHALRNNLDWETLLRRYQSMDSAWDETLRRYWMYGPYGYYLAEAKHRCDFDKDNVDEEFDNFQPEKIWYCVARDTGWEEHYFYHNGQKIYGHLGQDRLRLWAENRAVEICETYHGHCTLTQCWEE